MDQLWNRLGSFLESKAIWWALIVAGWILYMRQYLANRALWSDEASLALNLVHRSFAGLTQPLDYHQAAPVGFLFVVKFFLVSLGNNEYVLRLFPLLAAFLSLYIVYRLARQYLGTAGLVALLLIAGNIWLSYYASELKQYGVDVFIALLLIFLGMNCAGEAARARDFIWLAVAGILAVWISHVSIFILAGVGMTLVIERVLGKSRLPFWWLLALGAGWLLSFGLHYLLILRYTAVDPYFQTFWRKSFAPLPPWGNLGWYLKTYYQFLLILFTRTDPILFYLTPLMAALGLVSLFIRNRALALMVFLPFPMLLVASAFQKYPLAYRFMLFLIPLVFLLVAEGTWRIYWLAAKWRRDAAILVAILPVAAMLWYSLPFTLERLLSPQMTSDIRPVMQYIGERRQKDDIVYVYYSSVPAFLYYAPRYHLDSGNVQFQPEEIRKKVALQDFFEGVESLLGNERVWFVFSDIVDCAGCEGDRRDYFVESLNIDGTLLDQVEAPGEAGGYLYDLKP